MDELKDIIPVLEFLLPGFLAAWIFYGFTSFEPPAPFERIVQALIFTILVKALVVSTHWTLDFVGEMYAIFGPWTDDSTLLWSVLHGALIGVAVSYGANNNIAHELFSKLGVTTETSFPSQWVSAFSKNQKYVVLHLEGGRRIFGWPAEWAGSPDAGHIYLTDASWFTESEVIPLEGIEGILIPSKQIEYVEFVNKLPE